MVNRSEMESLAQTAEVAVAQFADRQAEGTVCPDHGDRFAMHLRAIQELVGLAVQGVVEGDDRWQEATRDPYAARAAASLGEVSDIQGYFSSPARFLSGASGFLYSGRLEDLQRVVGRTLRMIDAVYPDDVDLIGLQTVASLIPAAVHWAGEGMPDSQDRRYRLAAQLGVHVMARMSVGEICGQLPLQHDPVFDNNMARMAGTAVNLMGQIGAEGVNPTALERYYRTIANEADLIKRVHHLADAMPDVRADEEQIAAARESSDDLVRLMHRIRKYGVKDIDFPFGHVFPGTDMVLHDPRILAEGIGGSRAIATVRVVDANANVADKLTVNRRIVLDKPGLHEYLISGYLLLSIDDRGELHSGSVPDSGGTPLRAIFEARGELGRYELLRAEMLSRLFDAVAPAVVVGRLSGEGGSRTAGAADRAAQRSPGDSLDVVRQIVLPRIRYLRESNRATINKDYVSEDVAQQPNSVEAPGGTRRVRDHPVAGFLRPLPVGAGASQLAMEWYRLERRDESAVIPEGFTYVKSHRRGDVRLGTVIGHTAVKKTGNKA